jgi:NAD+ synthase (glutamine-hydrolysing)
MTRLRVAAGQINPVVGDLDGNVDRMRAALEAAEADAADLIVFPELAVTGYPPEDLLLKPTFVVDNRRALDKLAGLTDRCVAIVGFADRDGGRLHNAAAVCAGGEVVGVERGQHDGQDHRHCRCHTHPADGPGHRRIDRADATGHQECVVSRCLHRDVG